MDVDRASKSNNNVVDIAVSLLSTLETKNEYLVNVDKKKNFN